MQNLIFIDVETTGKELEDRLIQFAGCLADLYFENEKVSLIKSLIVNEYFKTFTKIKVEAMAIHHITEKKIQNKEYFIESEVWGKLKENSNRVMVAHNANFDREMLLKENILFNTYIDTLQCFKHLFPDLPQYNLSFLRYYFGIEVNGKAHDAEGDIIVLIELFVICLMKARSLFPEKNENEIINYLVELSSKPLLLKNLPFGKYKDLSFEQVQKNDRKYLSWLYSVESDKPKKDQNVNLVFTLKHWLS